MPHHSEGHSCSIEGSSSSSVRQTLEEMDFERGIWYAAQHNDSDRVEHLLKKGTSADAEDSAGYTALHYAARNGHISVCEKLIENGADLNAKTRSGRATALHRAASQGQVEVVELLLRAEADPDIKDADGFTALHRAVKADSIAVCKLLVSRSDLGVTDNRGRTCSRLAEEYGNEKIIDLIGEYQ